MRFSLFFFAADSTHESTEDKYRLLIEAARFADCNGFCAVWIPERHFSAFGGLYPNPSVVGAALAMVTRTIQIRAGSVVLPLQDPIRVAEEWSVLDHLSHGRVGIGIAKGWHVNDFVLAPETYHNRKTIVMERIRILQQLWQGETVAFPNGDGVLVPIRIYPKPRQPKLPIWLSGDSVDTFVTAGRMGASVLAGSVEVDEMKQRVRLYRQALAASGFDFDPKQGGVTYMLHTLIGKDDDTVRRQARDAYLPYLRTHLILQRSQVEATGMDVDVTLDDIDTIAENAFEHIYFRRGLIGVPDTCLKMVQRLKGIGVDEIACLIDFVSDFDTVMQGLAMLKELKDQAQETVHNGHDA